MSGGRMPSRQRAVALRLRREGQSSTSGISAGPTPTRYESDGGQDDSEDAEEGEESPPSESDDTEDEWRPQEQEKHKASKGKKRLFLDVEGDSESDEDGDVSDGLEEQEGRSDQGPPRKKGPATKPRRKRGGSVFDEDDPEVVPVQSKTAGSKHRPSQPSDLSLSAPKTKKKARILPTMTEAERQLKIMEREHKTRDRRQEKENAKELLEAEKAAAAAWEAVRAKKSSAASDARETAREAPQRSNGEASHTLSSWLGLAPRTSDIPNPTTCEAAQIVDRDSLFIGYVYPLESKSQHVLTSLLTHLNKVIHPHFTPVDLLPQNLRGAPPSKRGSTHDMYALRVLELKPGRNGQRGPDDYAIVEENEDDGEKWGSKHISRVMEEEGAVDCICIVSRWFGGSMLGPDRFKHIADAARAAIRRHINDESIKPMIEELRELDDDIVFLKCETQGTDAVINSQSGGSAPAYETFDLVKIERLLKARKQQLEFLRKTKNRKDQPTLPNVQAEEQEQSANAVKH